MLSYLTGIYHSKSIGASNKTRLNNPEVDALIDQACATIDEAEREEVLRQCSTLINELCPRFLCSRMCTSGPTTPIWKAWRSM